MATAARSDFGVLRSDMTVESALAHIRRTGVGKKIIYFYVAAKDTPTQRRGADTPAAPQ